MKTLICPDCGSLGPFASIPEDGNPDPDWRAIVCFHTAERPVPPHTEGLVLRTVWLKKKSDQ